MTPSIRQCVGAGLFVITLGAGVAQAELIHRFSFAAEEVKDSVGSVTGKLKGDGAKIAGGKLQLKNEDAVQTEKISYLEFNDSILPKTGTTVSLAVWFTVKDVGAFARILDLGDGDSGEGKQFIYFSPHTVDGSSRVAITATDVVSKTNLDFAPLDDGNPHMVVIVIDGAAKKLRVWVDGVEPKSAEDLGDNTLDKVKPVQNWLGKSLFSADPGLSGAIDELRIYDHALTAAEITAAYQAGPDTLPETAKAKPVK